MCVWTSNVCSSDLAHLPRRRKTVRGRHRFRQGVARHAARRPGDRDGGDVPVRAHGGARDRGDDRNRRHRALPVAVPVQRADLRAVARSEEHTSELQSLMRISYAVFCLKKKKQKRTLKLKNVKPKK